MDVTDRIVSKVNAVDDVKVAEACVTVADVSKVNAVPSVGLAMPCVEFAVPCVELTVYDGVVPVACVGLAVEVDDFP